MKEVNVTFITGNENKAKYLEKLLGLKIKFQKVDLDEIQTLDIEELVTHKVKQAYEKIKTPVLVEDSGLSFSELGGLPGTFIKFFVDNMPIQKICDLVKEDRGARAFCTYGYFDGENLQIFSSSVDGSVSVEPRGENGFGWDKIFIAGGQEKTNAELSVEENFQTYMKIKPIEKGENFFGEFVIFFKIFRQIYANKKSK